MIGQAKQKQCSKEDNFTSKAKHYVISTLLNTTFFMIMSVITKVINLIFNVLIARIISKESYGIATVYFAFIFLLLLYFPRETLRKTCLKYCPDENEELENTKFKQACNLIWLLNFAVVIVSIPISILFIMFGGGGGDSKGISEYKIHLFLYVFSAYLELITEPVIIYLNIKIDKTYRLIAMTIANYSRLSSNYLFAFLFGFDLWSFTLSRLLGSTLYFLYTTYVGLFVYNLHYSIFIPNIYGMTTILNNSEIKGIFITFTKATSLKMVLNYSERVVLSFFLQIGDSDKAEYTFVVENFHTFIKYIIEPAEENFYNLINKIKNYKGLTVIPCAGEEFSGDFSKNEILVQLYSNFQKKERDNENYSYKLLKLSLKLFYVFAVLLSCYIFLIGKDLVIYIFTEKWGTEQTISIVKAYSIYIGILAINSVVEAYANAVCSNHRMNLFNTLMVGNAIILVFLSAFLAQFNITGLVWANSIALLIRFFINVYFIIITELEQRVQNKELNDINKDTKFDDMEENQCDDESDKVVITNPKKTHFKTSETTVSNQLVTETLKFFNKSFMKTSAVLSTIICILFLNIIKDLLQYDDGNKPLLLCSAGVIFSLNCLLIYMVEKRGFIEIIRLKMVS